MPTPTRYTARRFAAALLILTLAGCAPQVATSVANQEPTLTRPNPTAPTIGPTAVAATPTEHPPCFSRDELAEMDLEAVASFPVLCFDPGYGPRTIVDQAGAIAVVRAFVQDPTRLVGFREMTFSGNSPSGTLPVGSFEDERGGSYLVALAARKVVEMSIDPGPSHPGAEVLSHAQLQAIAEDLLRRELPAFDALRSRLTFELGAKSGGVSFFRWELAGWPDDGSMPPLAQVGITDAGVVFGYINTLYGLE